MIVFLLVIFPSCHSPPPGLTLAHPHGLRYRDVAELVEAAVDDPRDAAANVQSPVLVVRDSDTEEGRKPSQKPRNLR